MKRIIIFSVLLLSATQSLAEIKLGLNWKAESEFGGFYAAQVAGIYKKHGLDVKILEGGAGTPTVQMLSAGTIDFGVISADELIVARSQKQDLVALYAAFQTAPYMIMSHTEKGFKTLADLFKSNVTLSIIKGLPFASFLEKKYSFKTVKVVPYAGGVSNFLADENFAQQGFISSEPLVAQKKGAKVTTFLIASEGFNPYVVVLATQEKTLKEKPEIVKEMVSAVREGWTEFLKNPGPTEELIAKLNPTMDAKTQGEMLTIERGLVETKSGPLGSMTEARWKLLTDQLLDLKLIK